MCVFSLKIVKFIKNMVGINLFQKILIFKYEYICKP